MEVKEMLFMNKGDGENSYVKTSGYTQKVAAVTQPVVYRAAQSLFTGRNSCSYQVLNVADLGCSSGPNTFTVMSTVIESTRDKCSELNWQMPEIQFYLNDLVGNDFNTLFKGLSVIQDKYKNVSCFAMGAPGSFHGRLFPQNSMHLIHSSYGVQWLSKVPKMTSEGGLSPPNKGKIYISKTSPPAVWKAYLSQFQEDFLSFLRCRSPELVPDGRMVLIIHGRKSADPTTRESCYTWEVLADAISYQVSQGLIDEEKLNSFNVPYYIPSQEEVRDLVNKEGSFLTEFVDTIEVELEGIWTEPENRAKNLRSFTEPMISHQFGEEVMDKLYDKVKDILVEDCKQEKQSTRGVSIVLELKKKESHLS
ncbi:hypothetical protein SCA6_000189 [Theobroma cacao]|uniref:Caffeine synthase 1 n=1 Tax=Theobroma cacao TaxID=3641 RepID=A0AB32ULD1_THECC|nr:7-methylxanthine methyltransferase 1 [Theobroma cacao]